MKKVIKLTESDLDDMIKWMSDDEGDYQHPEELQTEIDFSIIRDGNQAHIRITNNRFYHDKQIIRFLERIIEEKKLPVVYKTTGVIALIYDKALIEYYNHIDQNDETPKRKHIIVIRKDYAI